MPAIPPETAALRDALLREGARLLEARPHCHGTLNEMTAARMIAKMLDQGFDVSIEELEGCIHRMRVAVETGQYPHDMLRAAERQMQRS